ncbi:MAG: hypothetical protein RLZ67_710 [Actinomycetota bacterium]
MTWFVSEIPTPIKVESLEVRPYVLADAPALVRAVTSSLPELQKWMPWAKFEPQSIKQREELIAVWHSDWEAKRDFTLGIFNGSECVGGTGLHLRGDVGEVEIGYWIATKFTKQGIATRVSAALVDVALGIPEVQRVHISHDIANVASQGVPQRLGFTILREYPREPQAPSEIGQVRLWCITREEWHNR